MISATKAGPLLHLQEYQIIGSNGKTTQRDQVSGIDADIYTSDVKKDADGKQSTSAPVTARGKSGSEGTKGSKATKERIGEKGSGEKQSVIFVESVTDGTTPTALGFKRLENTVQNFIICNFKSLFEVINSVAVFNLIKIYLNL